MDDVVRRTAINTVTPTHPTTGTDKWYVGNSEARRGNDG
jgi:hypothetical protein